MSGSIGLLAASTFVKGSPTHLLTLAACAVAVVAACLVGRSLRRRSPELEKAYRWAWAGFIVVFQLFSQLWQNWPGHFDLRYTLPLHVCDLAALLAPVALVAPWRPGRALLYFWGAGLSVFAFLLPILREGPDHLAFWLFWIGHLQILGPAVYVVAVLDLRPTLVDARRAWLVTLAYVAAVFPVNVVFGTDYGNVGPDPSSTGMLGPWPWRVAVLLALEALLFFLLAAPWRLVARRSGH
jgi:hypothetical integral membrane protein (TIGR02206 family)